MRQAAVSILVLCTMSGPASAEAAEEPVHKGVATCASSLCHGSARDKPDSPVLRNEYLTWQRHSAHAGAWQTLKTGKSKRIARQLGVGPAHKADVCLDCHTDHVPEKQRGEQFLLRDGVGCEACHGGAENWLASHSREEVSHGDNVDNGLVPLEQAEVRARVCQDCHIGNQEQFASHDLLGAGHPRLQFELMSYSRLQPAHYEADADYYERKPEADRAARIWARGQLEAASRLLDGLRSDRFTDSPLWPEFAYFECQSCHTRMSTDRPARPYSSPGLRPGSVRVDDSALLMSLILARVLGGGDPESLLERIRALHEAGRRSPGNVRALADHLDEQIAGLGQHLGERELTDARQRSLLKAVVASGARGRYQGYLSAEQAAMATQVLLKHGRTGFEGDPEKHLDRIFDALRNPDQLDQGAFRRAMERLDQTLRQPGPANTTVQGR